MLRAIRNSGISPLPSDEFNEEGFRITKPEGTHFVRTAEFKDESAKILFLLKYKGR